MKHNKDLRVSIALLQSLLTQTDIVAEQRDAVRRSIAKLKRLSRKPDLTREEVFSCIRDISEWLFKAFGRNIN